MTKTLAMLVATTALTAAIGLPAWSAMPTQAGAEERPFAAVFDAGQEAFRLVLTSEDDRDDDEHSRRFRNDDDDDDDDDEDCDDDDDANEACADARNPAPAGSVAPPRNGLFGTGAPPKVQVN